MKRSIITLVALLLPSSALAGSPDLCTKELLLNDQNEPYVDSLGVTLSVHCEWTGPGAPVWDGDVCCSFDAAGASCDVPETEVCVLGADPYYCKHGEPLPDGGFTCFQEFPSACEAGFCDPETPIIQAPEGSSEDTICCVGGICVPWSGQDYEDCAGQFLFCFDGYSTVEGTVICFD